MHNTLQTFYKKTSTANNNRYGTLTRLKNKVSTLGYWATLIIVFISVWSCLPKSDPYPYREAEVIETQAQKISDSLETYIKKWVKGQVPAAIPSKYIPQGITDSKNFYLKNPDAVSSNEAWAIRPAKPIDLDSIYNGLPDPNVTYLFLATALAPFGSKLVIEGEFPHARFFSIQVSPPLNGKEYYANRVYGTAEVSLVDADIDPLPGNVNPYRVGENRNATNRKYRVEYDLKIGDPVALNDMAHKPLYRQKGNKRAGALLSFQGPWGSKDFLGNPIPGGGDWNLGCVWIRIYAPDKSKDALGGVPMPKVWFELPTGEKYFVGSDFSTFLKRANQTVKARVTDTKPIESGGPLVGWVKSWGLPRTILNGVISVNKWDSTQRVRDIDLGVTGRGEFQPAPGNYEAHATVNNYCSYLGRTVTVEPGMVAVLTGKLPTFPDTRNGNSVMQEGQIRYWSLGGYDDYYLAESPGTAVNMIMDDEVVINDNREYMIVYSNPSDRPANATKANGVSWVKWGPTSELGLMMRWVTVGPEWKFEKSPHEKNLTWAKTDYSGSVYDVTLIGQNTHKGFMGCYLPRVTYMTKQEFAKLGSNPNPNAIPVWIDPSSTSIGFSEASKKTSKTSSQANINSPSSNAFDGNLSTSWASAWSSEPQWLSVDLGKTKNISGIKLTWEFATAGTTYSIETANKEKGPWGTIYTTSSGDDGVDVINNLNASGRYVRLSITKGTMLTYVVKEMEVYSPEMDCSCCTSPVTGIDDELPEVFKDSRAVVLYPNPANNLLKFSFINPHYFNNTPIELSIIDLQSNQYIRQTVYTNTALIDVASLKSGSYILVTRYKGRTRYNRFIVSH